MYKNHPQLFAFMPHGPKLTYEDFNELQTHFCAKGWFTWSCYVSAHPGEASSENKKWVLCGSLALLDISLPDRRFEIGSVWFHPGVHGTFVTQEATYALLRFSFECLQAGRVQWKTHHQNIASQKAAIKMGFGLEGMHRKHIIHADGTWRHTLFYSMTDDDWFGQEETTDGRRGLDVAAAGAAAALKYANTTSKGSQRHLEEIIADRKKEGKALPGSVASGEPLA